MTQPPDLRSAAPLEWSVGSGVEVWELFNASAQGDLEKVEALVGANPALVRSQFEYLTALYFAVRENRVEVARFLIARGADPFGQPWNDSFVQMAEDRGYVEMRAVIESAIAVKYGSTPRGNEIAAAIRARDAAAVRALLDAAPDAVRAADRRGSQPIHWAVMTRQIGLIDELLGRGADINAQRPDGARPIQLTNGDYSYRGWRDVPDEVETTADEVFDHLVARGADVDIWTAAHRGKLERVRELLDRDPSLVNRNSDYGSYYAGCGSALKNAAAGGHLEIVRLLLDRGADPNLPEEHISPRGHALYSAVYHEHYEIAQLLLERGAHPNAEVESSADALSIAIRNGDQRFVDLLCSYGAASRLHLLAYYGDVKTGAAALAANPALAEHPEALSNAAEQGHEAFVRLLLRYRPRLAAQVGIAAKTPELTALLFEHGMDANYRSWLGITPLHEFARKGEIGNAALFVERGADLEARDEHLSSTPLGWAAKYGKADMAAWLLDHGASVNPAGVPRWATPLAWAVKRGHTAIAQELKKRGAVG